MAAITLEISSAQQEVLSKFPNPYVQLSRNNTAGEPLNFYEIIDDSTVTHYSVAADGKTQVEHLNGLGFGWTDAEPHVG